MGLLAATELFDIWLYTCEYEDIGDLISWMLEEWFTTDEERELFIYELKSDGIYFDSETFAFRLAGHTVVPSWSTTKEVEDWMKEELLSDPETHKKIKEELAAKTIVIGVDQWFPDEDGMYGVEELAFKI